MSGTLLNHLPFVFMAKYSVVYLAIIDSGSYLHLEFRMGI